LAESAKMVNYIKSAKVLPPKLWHPSGILCSRKLTWYMP